MVTDMPVARVRVLLQPRRAFASVSQVPHALLCAAAIVASAVVGPLAYVAHTDAVAVVTRELDRSPQAHMRTAAERTTAIAVGAKALPIFLPLGAATKRALWIALVTLLSWSVARLRHAKVQLAHLVAVAAVGSAPLVVRDVLQAVGFSYFDPLSFIDWQNSVPSNPAAWLHLDSNRSAGAALLRGLDVFSVWTCVLCGVGFGIVADIKGGAHFVPAFGAQVVVVVAAVVATLR